jgi:hypothetical protein
MAEDVPGDLRSIATLSSARRNRCWTRLQVVVCVLFAGGALWYILAPGADSRLVGRWQMQSELQSVGAIELVEFRSDGTCEKFTRSVPNAPLITTGLLKWKVKDGVLVILERRQPDSTVPTIVSALQSIVDRWNGTLDETQLKVLNVRMDRIELMTIPVIPGYEPKQVTLIRVQP